MPVTYCIHDLVKDQCADCKPGPKPPRQNTMYPAIGGSKLGRWFEATYHGQCAGCGDHIGPGDEIRADGEGGYLCGDCGEGE